MNAYELEAEVFKTLAHPIRVQILEILRDGEQCVCHIEAALNLRQAYISQQLMLLRQAGLVADRKDGLRVYYCVTEPGLYDLLDQARALVTQQAQKQGQVLEQPPEMARRGCTCPKCSQVSPARPPRRAHS